MIIKCKMCGGDLHPAENATTCECEFCGTVQTLPKLDNERRANLYDRANHFRRNNEYDKAMGIFEQILQDDRTDAEAYWSLVLCRYGIEYVEDPATHKRVPTVNRVQYTSILADEDYKSALAYADVAQRSIYEEEARTIDAIQKGILDISKKEKPFDVFICYKETDAEGKRTPDSVLANDLYHQLTREGFKVFFSRITLENKIGQQYEPYIFAALNSAKVMVVLGTKPEYFNAVWVKNEWSRYLALIKAGANKTLVPAYKDMDPYDLPEEFSHLQAQDMGKLGFMQDLIHGIKKIAGEDQPSPAQQPVVVQAATGADGSNVAALLDRAFLALEDGEWAKADDFCEKALNIDARNARAYIGKLMAEMKVCKEGDLQNQSQPIERSGNYQKAIRFADDKLKTQLTEANKAIKNRNEQERLAVLYSKAMSALNAAYTVEDVRTVQDKLSAMLAYKDTAKGLKACEEKIESIRSAAYNAANDLMKQQQYERAAAAFWAIGDYRDCQTVAKRCDELAEKRRAELAAEQAEQAKRNAERRAREEAERKEKDRIAAELKAREDEIRRREAEAKAARIKKISILAAAVAVVCVAAFMLFTNVIQPKMKYDNAVKAMKAGQNSVAVTAFTELGDYSDSKTILAQIAADLQFDEGRYADAWTAYAALPEEYRTHADDYAAMYATANALLTEGKYDEAAAAFDALGGYEDSASKAAQSLRDKADALYAAEKYVEAAQAYADIGDTDQANQSIYKCAGQLAAQGEYLKAAEQYETILSYSDSREQRYQLGLQARANGKLADAYTILSADADYRDAKEAIYQIGVSASGEQLYEVSVPAFTHVGAYKDAVMKVTMDTYAWGDQLYNNGEYDKAAETFAAMGDFSDAPTRANEARYAAAEAAMTGGQYDDAAARYTALGKYSDSADRAKAAAYAAASEQLEAGNYADAKKRFIALENYSDSPSKVKECDYRPAKARYESGQYQETLDALTAAGLSGYSDSSTIMTDCRYQLGKAAMTDADYTAARDWFDAAGDYSDSEAQAAECRRLIALAAAQALEAKGEYAAAYEQYGLCGETAKQQEMACQTAQTKLSSGSYADAVNWYEKAGDYSDAKEQLLAIGEYYYGTQQYDEAEAVYMKVLDTGVAAQRLYELGQYYEQAGIAEHAAQCYFEAGSYQDAPVKAIALQNELDYQAAEVCYAAKDWEGAKTLYAKISGYKDVDEKIVICDNEIAAAAALDAKYAVGNYVTFGMYPQTSGGDDSTPIEWLVLARDGNKALLISRYGLDEQPYNESWARVTWEECTLRTWLNGTFMNKAFTANEQTGILLTNVDNSSSQGYSGWIKSGGNNTQDKIFLLSYAEANQYLDVTYDDSKNMKSRVAPTAYAQEQGASTASDYKTADSAAAGWWWLRSPGCLQYTAAAVSCAGPLCYNYVHADSACVRPALWINLESGIF